MRSTKVKRFVVDAFALNIFILCVAFVVEVLISGIDMQTFWKGRLVMILPNILTITPYNMVRQFLDTKLQHWNSPFLRQTVRDTAVFILFRVPLMLIVLLLLGAPLQNVLTACLTATLASGFTGRPYGIFLDYARKLFGVNGG
ncbi:MAG: L-alanine exporter AlaE [Patescibacteria group bacterium]|nr:L-alanine exporter AlaE [Patescibacteria group bacterium]